MVVPFSRESKRWRLFFWEDEKRFFGEDNRKSPRDVGIDKGLGEKLEKADGVDDEASSDVGWT